MVVYGIYYNAECVYIGQTRLKLAKRWSKYVSDTRFKRNVNTMPIIRAMIKHGINSFVAIPLVYCHSLEMLDQVEIDLIAKIKPKYQASFGGVYKKKLTESTKLKIGAANKLRKPHQFRVKSILCVELGLKFISISEAARILKIGRRNICNALNGWNKKAGGYTFEYLPNKITYSESMHR